MAVLKAYKSLPDLAALTRSMDIDILAGCRRWAGRTVLWMVCPLKTLNGVMAEFA